MPISTLDTRAALIVIDLQAGIVSLPLAPPADEVVAHAAELAAAFRRHHLPVVLVNIDGFPPGRTEIERGIPAPPGWTDLVPELDARPSDHRITKRGAGAFTGTGLQPLLRSLGVTQVVVAGIATSAGVEMTARHAFELGFHVALAVDAMTDRDAEVHGCSIAGIFRRIGETGMTAEIVAMLDAARAPS